MEGLKNKFSLLGSSPLKKLKHILHKDVIMMVSVLIKNMSNFQKENLRSKTYQSLAKEVLKSNFQFFEHYCIFRYRTQFIINLI
jgi:hypothetical protein